MIWLMSNCCSPLPPFPDNANNKFNKTRLPEAAFPAAAPADPPAYPDASDLGPITSRRDRGSPTRGTGRTAVRTLAPSRGTRTPTTTAASPSATSPPTAPSEKKLADLIASPVVNTVTLIPMAKNVNSLMSVDFRAILPMKRIWDLMKTSNGKIPSILMTGSELQLLFNFPTMKFPTLPGPDREFPKPRDLLHLNNLNAPPNPNAPPKFPKGHLSPNNSSTISNSNPNVLLLPSEILVCSIGPQSSLPNNNNNNQELYKTFSTLYRVKKPLPSPL